MFQNITIVGGLNPKPPAGFFFSKSSSAIGALCAFIAIVYLYSPALNGSFVFDDASLPFAQVTRDGPLSAWISGVRPALMFSYWLNYRMFGDAPFSYHFVNVAIHFFNITLVLFVLRRLLTKVGWTHSRATLGSAAGALIFAIHPLQTESVSYVAGRSESLAALFMLLAYAIFLYRRHEAISWRESVAILLLFGLGLKTKENAVSLVGILILTDLFFPLPFSLAGIKRNWRLYGLMVPGLIAAVVVVLRLLARSQSAGFSTVTFKWYQYAFTEARALFTYVRLAIFPIGQSIDQDYPTSHNMFEHGAIVYMLLLAGLVALAIVWRKRYPLFCFGLLMFLIWLAPTSSVIPIDDALVERRMYLPLLGLILIGCEFLPRLRFSQTSAACTLAVVTLIFGKLAYDRNQLWGQPDKLLALAAQNAVYNPRPMLNFTGILIQHNRCDLAPAYLERAERRLPNNYYVNAAWGRTLACLGRYDQAIARLKAAVRLSPRSQAYEWMGIVYGEMGKQEEAGRVLAKAVELAPNSESAHGSLALWYEKTNNFEAAEQEYGRALSLDHGDSWARLGLIRAHEMRTAVR